MDLEGKYEWTNSKRTGMPIISFILHSKRWIRDERFDARLVDGAGIRQPRLFPNLLLEHGKSYRFDFDTVDWEWKVGDSFVITRRNGKDTRLQWVFNTNDKKESGCPECHGTQKCPSCNGRGVNVDANHTVHTCQRCHGTGRCQSCYVPSHSETSMPADDYRRRRMATLKDQIWELREKITREEWNLRMMQSGPSMSQMTIQSQNQLIYSYRKQMDTLQHELRQLEMEDNR